jgi:hypothetical protein
MRTFCHAASGLAANKTKARCQRSSAFQKTSRTNGKPSYLCGKILEGSMFFMYSFKPNKYPHLKCFIIILFKKEKIFDFNFDLKNRGFSSQYRGRRSAKLPFPGMGTRNANHKEIC